MDTKELRCQGINTYFEKHKSYFVDRRNGYTSPLLNEINFNKEIKNYINKHRKPQTSYK